jgi:hypothetical protein
MSNWYDRQGKKRNREEGEKEGEGEGNFETALMSPPLLRSMLLSSGVPSQTVFDSFPAF